MHISLRYHECIKKCIYSMLYKIYDCQRFARILCSTWFLVLFGQKSNKWVQFFISGSLSLTISLGQSQAQSFFSVFSCWSLSAELRCLCRAMQVAPQLYLLVCWCFLLVFSCWLYAGQHKMAPRWYFLVFWFFLLVSISGRGAFVGQWNWK